MHKYDIYLKMKSCFWIAVVLLIGMQTATVTASSKSNPTFDHCKYPKYFPNPLLLEKLQKGFNLPSWDAKEEARRPSDAALISLLDAGMKHIRLPIDPEQILNAEQSDAYILRLLKTLRKYIIKGFVVSIDLHPGVYLLDLYAKDPQLALSYLTLTWNTLIPQLKEFSADQITIELLNEPPTTQNIWWPHAENLLKVVRALRPQTSIIIAAADYSRIEPLIDSKPFADRNVIYAFHYYDPFAFTHQGAPWHSEDDPIRQIKGLPFPASLDDVEVREIMWNFERTGRVDLIFALRDLLSYPWTSKLITEAFQGVAAWAVQHDIPVIMNEFGVLKFYAPKASRMRWIEEIINSSSVNCIGWAHWDYADGFGFIDEETGLPESSILKLMK
jgi:endoglucanase